MPGGQNQGLARSFANAAKFEPVTILHAVLVSDEISAALHELPAHGIFPTQAVSASTSTGAPSTYQASPVRNSVSSSTV